MKSRKFKKILSIFAASCVLAMNLNVGFSINSQGQSSTQPVSQNLSVTQAVYATATCTPTSAIATVTQSVYPTPYPTVTGSSYPPFDCTPTMTPTPCKEDDDYGNSTMSAHIIKLNSEVKGKVSYIGDIDYFCFRPSEDGAYYIEKFSTSKTENNYYDPYMSAVLRAFDSDGNNFSIYFDSSRAYFNLSKDKTYYICVTNINFYSIFNYSFVLEGPIKDDIGSTKETASEIQPDRKVEGTIDYLPDEDYFFFKPSENGVYYIKNFNAALSDTGKPAPLLYNVLNIFDSNNNSLDAYYDNSADGYFNLYKDNTYYISISNGRADALFGYSFELGGPMADDYGNTKETAQEIQQDAYIEGHCSYWSDSDYFSFKPEADGIYYLDNFTSSGNRYFEVSDSSGNKKDVSFIGTKAYFSVKKDTQYYIYLTNFDYYTTFNYSFTLRGPVKDDYGNSKESACEIKSDSLVNGTSDVFNDSDFFSFTPSANGLYYIDDFTTDDERTYLGKVFSLYDDIGYVEHYRESNSKASFYLTKDTTYYISITSPNYYWTFSYSFTVKGPVEDDYGNVKEAAQEIKTDIKVEGKTNYYNDIDCFSFIPSTDGIYFIDNYTTAGDSNASLNNVIKIFDANGGNLSIRFYNSKFAFSLTKDNTYYISITSNDYSRMFSYSFVLKGPAIDEGNTMETAGKIQLDTKVEGYADIYYDKDYFSFKPSETGPYYIDNFTVSNNSNYSSQYIDNNLRIIDSDGYWLDVIYDHDSNNKAYFTLSKDKTYYIVISCNDYNASFNYSFVLKGPIADDYGNSIESAAEIQLDTAVKGNINYFFDYDYFCFKPSTTGVYYIDNIDIKLFDGLSYHPSIINTFKVVDSKGNDIYINYDNYNDYKPYVYLTKDNKYFIYITNIDYTFFDYSFTIKGTITDDYGNTPSYSKSLEIGESVTGKIDYPGDKDSFSFTTTAKGLYYISVPGIDSGYIALYDENYSITNSYPFNLDSSKPYYNLMPNQTYYVIVEPYNCTANYSIYVNGPIIDDYGNSVYTGSIVKMGDTNATINYPGDIDVFKFIPSTSGTYYFKLKSDRISAIKVYDSSGGYVKYTNVAVNTLSCNLAAGNTYSISVNYVDVIEIGNYTLTISDAPEQDTFKITGYVKPDFVDNTPSAVRAGFKVSVAGTLFSAQTDENGYFEISNMQKSDKRYVIEITKDNYLKREIKDVVVNGDISISQAGSPTEMWAGDLIESQDGAINIIDILQIVQFYNTREGDGKYLARMDLNDDSVINIADIMIVVKNFNRTAQSYR